MREVYRRLDTLSSGRYSIILERTYKETAPMTLVEMRKVTAATPRVAST
jgi:hypothetical protein